MSWEVLVGPLLQLAIYLIGMAVVPVWSRSGLYFGVTVNKEFRESVEAGRIYRTYLKLLLGLSLPLAAALAANSSTRPFMNLSLIAGFWVGFQWARRQVQPYKQAPVLEREAILFSEELREIRAWHWLLPLLMPLAVAVWIWWRWENLEGIAFTIPKGLYGRERNHMLDRFVLPPLALMAIMMNLALWYTALQGRTARFVSVSGPSYDSERRRRSALLQLYLGQSYLSNAAIALFVAGVAGFIPVGAAALAAGAALLLGGAYWWRRSQQLARQRFLQEKSTDGMRDENWKFGVYYFNREDSSLFVEDRSGISFALNFGNPIAWLISLGFLLIPILSFTFLWPK